MYIISPTLAKEHRDLCRVMISAFFLMFALPSCSPNQNVSYNQDVAALSNTQLTTQNAVTAFDKNAWESYFGLVNEEPTLPNDINKILESACPFWPDKKIKDTHLLAMVPVTVDGNPLTPRQMIELAQKPKAGRKTAPREAKEMKRVSRRVGDEGRYSRKNMLAHANALRDSEEEITQRCLRALKKKASTNTQPYWILMTRDVVNTDVSSESLKARYPEYDALTVLEAATGVLTHYTSTGQWIYAQTHTYCKDTISDHKKSFFVGKSSKTDQLIIDEKMRTAIRFEGNENAPKESIPLKARGQGLLRRLKSE